MKWRRILIGFVHWTRAPHFIRQNRARYYFGSTNWRTSRVKFSSERVVIAVLKMVCFGVGVRCGADVLKIRFCKRRLVCRKRVLGRSTGAEKNKGDERRENG